MLIDPAFEAQRKFPELMEQLAADVTERDMKPII